MKTITFQVAASGEFNPAGIIFTEEALREMRHQLQGRPVVASKSGRVVGRVSNATLKQAGQQGTILSVGVDVEDGHADYILQSLEKGAGTATPMWEGPVRQQMPGRVVGPQVIGRGILLG